MIHKLEIDSIQLVFGNKIILSNIYLKCETGEIVGILGRNGQGKTSLMNVIYGNLNPIYKSIRFDSISFEKAFTRPDLITYLPQVNFIPLRFTLKRVFSDYNLDAEVFLSLFPEFLDKYTSLISNLSGGEKRLIEVYIIIKSNSKFSMLDEPFSQLTPIHIQKIMELLMQEKDKKGFIITDHLYKAVLDVSTNLFVLKDGNLNAVKSITDIEKFGYARL